MSSVENVEESGDYYILRSPVQSSIYPFITSRDKTLSLLYEINASQHPSKRLPAEILFQVNNELHRPNSLWEDIRATWKAAGPKLTDAHNGGGLTLNAELDMDTKRYCAAQEEPGASGQIIPKFSSVEILWKHASAADILYRLLCYFPGMYSSVGVEGYKSVWGALVQHQPTGMFLFFSEQKAGANVHAYYGKVGRNAGPDELIAPTKIFRTDSIKLFNALFGTVAGTRRFSCYHPAADADYPTSKEGYVAVPIEISRDRIYGEDELDDDYYDGNLYDKVREVYHYEWRLSTIAEPDVSSSHWHSILQDLKYNTQTRKIDRSNGATNLTTVISSALLLYRLICQYLPIKCGCVDQAPVITSVWQIKVTHRRTKESVIFMDDHGLFDIRASAGIDKVMDDVDALVEALCSDTCPHSYDGVVAGCVA